MHRVFEVFATLLAERLTIGVLTTEDSVRYTFFHALLSSGLCRHTDVILELPHPTIEKARIDTFITARQSEPSVGIEFKYDRMIPSQANQPRTQKAGHVFNDLYRLARIPTTITQVKFFIYLTDAEMLSYFQNARNNLQDFFELPIGQSIGLGDHFSTPLAPTFRKVVLANQIECTAIAALKRDLPNHHALRIYEIKT